MLIAAPLISLLIILFADLDPENSKVTTMFALVQGFVDSGLSVWFGEQLAGLGNIQLLLMIPATLAASMAFMLLVATPPNAIIFGTNRIRIIDMVKTGFMLNTISIIIITLVMYFWGTVVFGIDTTVFPDWAVTVK
jgi:sodium-dependent dicarboxylate transporter 2/3/5